MSTSSSSSTWASLVSYVKTHLTTLPPQGEQLRTGKSDVYQQPIASLSPESSRVKEDPLVAGAMCLFLSHTPITRDEEVLDARGGLVVGVGGTQEEQGWRRRAL